MLVGNPVPPRALGPVGGLEEADGHLMEEITWEYDIESGIWEALNLAVNPGKRAFSPMTYAPSVGKAILFGGEITNKRADEISDETWIFDPATDEWQKVNQP